MPPLREISLDLDQARPKPKRMGGSQFSGAVSETQNDFGRLGDERKRENHPTRKCRGERRIHSTSRLAWPSADLAGERPRA